MNSYRITFPEGIDLQGMVDIEATVEGFGTMVWSDDHVDIHTGSPRQELDRIVTELNALGIDVGLEEVPGTPDNNHIL